MLKGGIVATKILDDWREHFSMYIATPEVLRPYRRERSKLRRFFAHAVFLLFCIWLGLVYGFFFTVFPASLYVLLALPIAFLSLVVIWALPDREGYPGRTIPFLFIGYMFSLIIWPNYLCLAYPGLPWITVNRLFTFPLALVVLITLSTRRSIRLYFKDLADRNKLVSFCLIGFVLIQLLTIPMSNAWVASINRVVELSLNNTLLLLAAIWVFRQERFAKAFIGICLFFAFYQISIGVAERIQGAVLWAPYVPDLLKGDPELVDKILRGTVRVGSTLHRSQGTFTTALSYAEFLALTVPFTLAATFYSRRLFVKVIAAACFIGSWVAIYYSESRLGFVGGFAGMALMLLLAAVRLYRDKTINSMLQPVAFLAGPLIGMSVILLSFVSGRVRTIVWGAQHTVGSDQSREFQYHVGMQKLLQWPFGYGSGQAATQIGQANPDGSLNIDTYYMMIALDFGVLGFLLYYGMFAWAIVRAAWFGCQAPSADYRGNLCIAACSSLLVFMVTKSVLSQEDTHPFVFIILGLAMALIYSLERNSSPSHVVLTSPVDGSDPRLPRDIGPVPA
jgi:hypothetical protein